MLIKKQQKKCFFSVLREAEADPKTTGVLLLLLAPRTGGLTRQAILKAGAIPFDLLELVAGIKKTLQERHQQ